MKYSFEDGIDAARVLLSGNTWFHKTNCERGLDALRSYARRYNDKLEIWEKGPAKSWANHGADAFKYAALEIGGEMDQRYGTLGGRKVDIHRLRHGHEWDEFGI